MMECSGIVVIFKELNAMQRIYQQPKQPETGFGVFLQLVHSLKPLVLNGQQE